VNPATKADSLSSGIFPVAPTVGLFIFYFFWSGTDLVSLVIFLLIGRPSVKKPKAPSFQIGSGRNMAGLFFT